MASFASSATTCGARKHAWTNLKYCEQESVCNPSEIPWYNDTLMFSTRLYSSSRIRDRLGPPAVLQKRRSQKC